MKWIRNYWPGLLGIACLVSIGAFMFFVLKPRSDLQDLRRDLRERRRADCIQVLRCIDLGVEREQCDDLFPACKDGD